MAGREVREYTNLSETKDKKLGSKFGKEKIDDEDLAFKRMVAKGSNIWSPSIRRPLSRELFPQSSYLSEKMQEVAGERGGYLHGRGALDSDDLLYLKEQMEAEEDAERLRRRTEKRAFAAFKKAASLVDALPLPVLQPLRVEPKPHTGIRQQVLVKSIVEVKRKRHRISGPTDATTGLDISSSISNASGEMQERDVASSVTKVSHEQLAEEHTNGSGILGLAYGTSDDEEESDPGHEKGLGKDIAGQSTVASKNARCGHERSFPADPSLS